MIEFLAVAVPAVIIGFSSLLAAFAVGIRSERARADADVAWLRSELRQANDRLYAVSREAGVVIPPRDAEPVDAVPALPGDLERLVSDWESPDVQESLRAQFAKMIADGLSPAEVKRRHLEA